MNKDVEAVALCSSLGIPLLLFLPTLELDHKLTVGTNCAMVDIHIPAVRCRRREYDGLPHSRKVRNLICRGESRDIDDDDLGVLSHESNSCKGFRSRAIPRSS